MGIQVHFRDFFGAYMCEFELCSKLTINEVVTGLVILNTDWFQKSYWRGGAGAPQGVDPLTPGSEKKGEVTTKSFFDLTENCEASSI